MSDTGKSFLGPIAQWGVAIAVSASIGAAIATAIHRSPDNASGATAHGAAVSAEQRGRIESLAKRSLQGVDVLDVGQGPYGMSWAVLAKDGTRQVAWVTPGELSLMLGDLFVGGANLSQEVRLSIGSGAPVALPPPAPTGYSNDPVTDLQVMPIAAPVSAPNQGGLDPSGTDLRVAGAFMQVKDSFFSIPLYGNGSGGEILVFADPDCRFCHDLLQRLNASAAGITSRGIRVRWYPVGVLHPENGHSLQRAAAQLQSGPADLLAGGVVNAAATVTQESLRRTAMNTKALGEISPRQILTPTILFRNHSGQSVVRLGAPTSDEEFVALINGVGK